MKGKWKILSFIMATILCVAIFAGCGTQENTSSASNEPAVSGAADTTKQIDTMVIGTTMKITSISRETYDFDVLSGTLTHMALVKQDENGDLKYEFEWGERPYVFMGYVRRDFDRRTVIVGAKTYTKYVGDYYVAFEPENKRFVPIYPITDEAWELYGHTMLEGNKILAANPKYVKVIDIPSRKVLAKYEPEETIYSATFLTKNKGAIFTNRGVYEFTF